MSELRIVDFPTMDELGAHLSLKEIGEMTRGITDVHGVPQTSDRGNSLDEIDFDYTVCPYTNSPSRLQASAGNPLPMSGLEKNRLDESLHAIYKLLLATRQEFLLQFDKDPREQITISEGISILGIISSIPHFAVTRTADAVAKEREFPQHIIVGSNSASGGIGALEARRETGSNKFPEKMNYFVSLIESLPHQPLVGERTVCVANSNVIKRYLGLLARGQSKIKYGSVEEETAGIITSEELPRLVTFSEHCRNLDALSNIMKVSNDLVSREIVDVDLSCKEDIQRCLLLVNEFRENVWKYHQTFKQTTFGKNLALSREPFGPELDFDDLRDNPLGFSAIRLAEERGFI